jgi:hypothetical protein
MQNLTTRETGKQQIKDDEVILIRLGKLPATFAIACYVYGKTLGSQAPRHKSGNFLLVFDQQDAHF